MHLGQIDLNLLFALDALLCERHVSRAGERVGLSQPAMSSALRRLRAIFGDELLVRVGRDYQRTPLAEELAPQVREILRLIERTVDHRPQFNPATDRRVFRIAASDLCEYLLLRPLLERMAVEAPHVSIEVQSLAARHTIDLIEGGDLDLGMWRVGVFECNLIQQPLFEDRVVCAVWAGCPGIGDALSAEEFARLPHATYNWSWYDRSGHNPPDHCAPDDASTRLADDRPFVRLFMLRGTHMVTYTSEELGRRLADAAEVRLLEPPVPFPPYQEGMLWHPRNTGDPAHRWLRRQLVEIAEDLEQSRQRLRRLDLLVSSQR